MSKGSRRNKNEVSEARRLKKTLRKLSTPKNKIIRKVENDFYLSEQDRCRWVMEFDELGLKRVTISYEIEIDKEWITIKMYDNTHETDYLHRHTKESLRNRREIYSTDNVIKKGTPSDWLNWARKDIVSNWFYYRKAFLKRSKLVDNK